MKFVDNVYVCVSSFAVVKSIAVSVSCRNWHRIHDSLAGKVIVASVT